MRQERCRCRCVTERRWAKGCKALAPGVLASSSETSQACCQGSRWLCRRFKSVRLGASSVRHLSLLSVLFLGIGAGQAAPLDPFVGQLPELHLPADVGDRPSNGVRQGARGRVRKMRFSSPKRPMVHPRPNAQVDRNSGTLREERRPTSMRGCDSNLRFCLGACDAQHPSHLRNTPDTRRAWRHCRQACRKSNAKCVKDMKKVGMMPDMQKGEKR